MNLRAKVDEVGLKKRAHWNEYSANRETHQTWKFNLCIELIYYPMDNLPKGSYLASVKCDSSRQLLNVTLESL